MGREKGLVGPGRGQGGLGRGVVGTRKGGLGRGVVGMRKRTGWSWERTRWIRERSSWDEKKDWLVQGEDKVD